MMNMSVVNKTEFVEENHCMKKSKSFDNSENKINIKMVIGILIICFFLLPNECMFDLYSTIQDFIKIPLYFISGSINMMLLLVACYLCKYPFLLRSISLYDIFKQIGSAALLLIIMILISGFFVEYTSIYQENHSLFSFIVHQIIFIGVFEELLFRGVLVYIARKFISSEILIVVLCSLVFTFSHIGSEVFSILQITSSFIIGVAFTLLILKLPDYFSVYNIGIVHGLFNVIVLGFTTYMKFN